MSRIGNSPIFAALLVLGLAAWPVRGTAQACGLPGPVPALLLIVTEVARGGFKPDVTQQQRLASTVQRVEEGRVIPALARRSGPDAGDALDQIAQQARAMIAGRTLMEFEDVAALVDRVWSASAAPCKDGSGARAQADKIDDGGSDSSVTTRAETSIVNALAEAQGLSPERLTMIASGRAPPSGSTILLASLVVAALAAIASIFMIRSVKIWILGLILGRKACQIPAYLKLPDQTLHGFATEIDLHGVTYFADSLMAKDAFKALGVRLPAMATVGIADLERTVMIVEAGEETVVVSFDEMLGPKSYLAALDASIIPTEYLSRVQDQDAQAEPSG